MELLSACDQTFSARLIIDRMSLEPLKRAKGGISRARDTANLAGMGAKKEKFDFQKMKAAATSDDPAVRKAEFLEYFERFKEFPSFLFENEQALDPRLAETMRDLSADKTASEELLEGVKALLGRLPS